MKVAVSEVQQFLRCRRAWDLQSQNRKGLVRVTGPAVPLQIGSTVHAALAAQAVGQDPLAAADKYITEEHDRFEADYLQAVGVRMSSDELQVLDDTAAEALYLAARYIKYYGPKPFGDDYETILVEQTFEVPIPRTKNFLIGTYDRLVRHTPTGTYWIIDHKTYGNTPNIDKLSIDWQFLAYTWAAEQLFGQPIEGVIYDGISKKIPASRSMEGDLSKFFVRHEIRFPRAALLSTEHTLTDVSREMASPKTKMIPNFTWLGCFDCSVRDLCKSMHFGEDTDFLIKAAFRRGEGHATVRRLSRPRQEVRSFADLERQS